MNSVTFKVTVDKEDRSALMTFVQEKGGSIEECAVQAARPQEAESLLISEDKNAERSNLHHSAWKYGHQNLFLK